jgi:arabinofuranan 3-O-arabinosyltransferase
VPPAGDPRNQRELAGKYLAAVMWPLAALTFCHNVFQAAGRHNGVQQGIDTLQLWKAAHAFVHGAAIYKNAGPIKFVYPPSTLAFIAPLGLVGTGPARAAIFVLQVAAILLAGVLLLRLFGHDWRGPAGAFLLFGISISLPFVYSLSLGNLSGIVLLGEAVMLLAASRSRWVLAGVALGVTLALKPVIAPVVLIFALYRKWRALAISLLIPCILSGIVLLASTSAHGFFHVGLPELLKGESDLVQGFSLSLTSEASRLGSPHVLTVVLQILVVLAACAIVWRRMRRPVDPVHQLVELTSAIILATLLLSTVTFAHYVVFLLPLAIWATEAGSPAQRVIAWTGVYCVASTDVWQSTRLPDFANKIVGLKVTAGFVVLLGALWWATTAEPPDEPASG